MCTVELKEPTDHQEKISQCSHVASVSDLAWEEIVKLRTVPCHGCDYAGNSRWLCLTQHCLAVLCGENASNHCAEHMKTTSHPLQLNLKSLRVWCHACEAEVLHDSNTSRWNLGHLLAVKSKSERFRKQSLTVSSSPPSESSQQGSSYPLKLTFRDAYVLRKNEGISHLVLLPLVAIDRSSAGGNLVEIDSNKRSTAATNGEPVHSLASDSAIFSSFSADVPGCASADQLPLIGRVYRERYPFRINSGFDDADDVDESDGPIGLTGLGNVGNTCYANAALQALSNCVPLLQYFRVDEGREINDSRKWPVAYYFGELLKELWSPQRRSYLVPNKLLYLVRERYAMFRGFNQQDSQEFLRCLMDLLHEDLKQPLYHWEVGERELRHITRKCVETDDGSTSSVVSEDSTSLSSSASSPRESDYETADSGPSPSVEKKLDANKLRKIGRRRCAKRINGGTSFCDHQNCESNSSDDDDDAASSCSSFVHSPPEGSIRFSHSRARRHTETDKDFATKHKPVKYRSIISDIFDGKIVSSVQCLTCRTISKTVEPFQDLSLPIPSADQLTLMRSGNASCAANNYYSQLGEYKSGWSDWVPSFLKGWLGGPSLCLSDCLAAFFAADDLKGDDMYSCDKCKRLRNGTKYCKLLELPEVICIHLKRFKHEFTYSTKISTRVTFPLLDLDLKPFLHRGGHYVAYCLNNINGRWYEFDDTSVTQVDPSVVEGCEAYVLFYRKNQRDAQTLRLKMQSSMFMEAEEETSLGKFHVSRYWISKFNSFAEPGPISNYDFLCVHGGIPPTKEGIIEDLFVLVPARMWEVLYERFGGGPVCSTLSHCLTCQKEYQQLEVRRVKERETFKELEAHAKSSGTPQFMFAVSLSWIKDWDSFIWSKQYLPPGPIDNTSIVGKKNDQPFLRQGSDYLTLSGDLWEYLYSIYGGGPEVVFTPTTHSVTVRVRTPSMRSPMPEDCAGEIMPFTCRLPATRECATNGLDALPDSSTSNHTDSSSALSLNAIDDFELVNGDASSNAISAFTKLFADPCSAIDTSCSTALENCNRSLLTNGTFGFAVASRKRALSVDDDSLAPAAVLPLIDPTDCAQGQLPMETD